MMRTATIAAIPLLLLVAGCGPGSVAAAIRPADRTAANALGEPGSGAQCKDVGKEGKPLVVDWKPEQRGDLEVAMQGGLAVVHYDCQSIKLLENCHVDGSYGFKGIVLKQQVVKLNDADEVKVNLPLSGAALAANLEGAAGRGSSLDLATALVGNRVSTRMTVTKADLQGMCDGATHFVRGANIGAFVLEQGSKAEVKTAVQIFKVGGGGSSESSKLARQQDGDIESCQSSSAETDKPPPKCGALVRLSLVAIGDAPEAAKPATPGGVSVKDESDGCPAGLHLVDGKCTKLAAAAATKHVCKAGDLDDCKAQCAADEGWSCSRYGAALLANDGAGAATSFKKSCDLGHAGGCSNYGLLLSKGTGVAKNDGEAATFFLKACQGGDPTGCFNLAMMTYQGAGVGKDLGKAAKLFGQACDAGSAAACVNLGVAYDEGTGVPKDGAKALALYKRACEGDKAEGCTNLGVAYSTGQGAPEDQAAATKYYTRGCNLGSGKSCSYLAGRYRDGKGADKDANKAKELYKKACDLKEASACDALKSL
jgi:hypothetical protein